MGIYRLIDAEKIVYPVCILCRVLGVSRTTKIHEIHQRSRAGFDLLKARMLAA